MALFFLSVYVVHNTYTGIMPQMDSGNIAQIDVCNTAVFKWKLLLVRSQLMIVLQQLINICTIMPNWFMLVALCLKCHSDHMITST